MPFLTQGNTNWKFLLIVIVLVVIVGGGVLIYQYWWILKQEINIETDLISKEKEEKNKKDNIIKTINFNECNNVAIFIDNDIKNKITERIKEIFPEDAKDYGYESPWVSGEIILPTVCEINLSDNVEIKEYAVEYPVPGGSYIDIYKKTEEEWKITLSSSGRIMIIQTEKGETDDMHNILIVYSLGADSGRKVRYEWNSFAEEYEENQMWEF